MRNNVKHFAKAALIQLGGAILLMSQMTLAHCAEQYEIEAAVNDEHFIINGEKFDAKSYCLGWEEGDMVIFVDGSPLGVCVTATLYNVARRETCEVWCE